MPVVSVFGALRLFAGSRAVGKPKSFGPFTSQVATFELTLPLVGERSEKEAAQDIEEVPLSMRAQAATERCAKERREERAETRVSILSTVQRQSLKSQAVQKSGPGSLARKHRWR